MDFGVDTSTPAGEAMASVLATFAQFERRLIAQRTKEALAGKKSQRVRIGRPRTLAREVVDRIVAERASGLTLQAIADGLNRLGQLSDSTPARGATAGPFRAVPSTAKCDP